MDCANRDAASPSIPATARADRNNRGNVMWTRSALRLVSIMIVTSTVSFSAYFLANGCSRSDAKTAAELSVSHSEGAMSLTIRNLPPDLIVYRDTYNSLKINAVSIGGTPIDPRTVNVELINPSRATQAVGPGGVIVYQLPTISQGDMMLLSSYSFRELPNTKIFEIPSKSLGRIQMEVFLVLPNQSRLGPFVVSATAEN